MRRLRRSCKTSKLFSQDSDREKDAEEIKQEVEGKQEARKPKPIDGQRLLISSAFPSC